MKLKSKIFNWLFKDQLEELQNIKSDCQKSLDLCRTNNQTSATVLKEVASLELRLRNTVGGIGVSADIHQFAPSWAVVCIQGKKDFVKFINLGDRDIREIASFLRQFDRRHVNADLPSHFRNTDQFIEITR